MLDNFELEAMGKQCSSSVAGWRWKPAVGELETVKAIAETGVDFISVGELTHTIDSLDLSFQGDDLALNPVTIEADGDSADKTLVILRHAAKPSVVSYPCVVPATGILVLLQRFAGSFSFFNRDLFPELATKDFCRSCGMVCVLISPPSCTSTCSSLQVISYPIPGGKLRDTSSYFKTIFYLFNGIALMLEAGDFILFPLRTEKNLHP